MSMMSSGSWKSLFRDLTAVGLAFVLGSRVFLKAQETPPGSTREPKAERISPDTAVLELQLPEGARAVIDGKDIGEA